MKASGNQETFPAGLVTQTFFPSALRKAFGIQPVKFDSIATDASNVAIDSTVSQDTTSASIALPIREFSRPVATKSFGGSVFSPIRLSPFSLIPPQEKNTFQQTFKTLNQQKKENQPMLASFKSQRPEAFASATLPAIFQTQKTDTHTESSNKPFIVKGLLKSGPTTRVSRGTDETLSKLAPHAITNNNSGLTFPSVPDRAKLTGSSLLKDQKDLATASTEFRGYKAGLQARTRVMPAIQKMDLMFPTDSRLKSNLDTTAAVNIRPEIKSPMASSRPRWQDSVSKNVATDKELRYNNGRLALHQLSLASPTLTEKLHPSGLRTDALVKKKPYSNSLRPIQRSGKNHQSTRLPELERHGMWTPWGTILNHCSWSTTPNTLPKVSSSFSTCEHPVLTSAETPDAAFLQRSNRFVNNEKKAHEPQEQARPSTPTTPKGDLQPKLDEDYSDIALNPFSNSEKTMRLLAIRNNYLQTRYDAGLLDSPPRQTSGGTRPADWLVNMGFTEYLRFIEHPLVDTSEQKQPFISGFTASERVSPPMLPRPADYAANSPNAYLVPRTAPSMNPSPMMFESRETKVAEIDPQILSRPTARTQRLFSHNTSGRLALTNVQQDELTRALKHHDATKRRREEETDGRFRKARRTATRSYPSQTPLLTPSPSGQPITQISPLIKDTDTPPATENSLKAAGTTNLTGTQHEQDQPESHHDETNNPDNIGNFRSLENTKLSPHEETDIVLRKETNNDAHDDSITELPTKAISSNSQVATDLASFSLRSVATSAFTTSLAAGNLLIKGMACAGRQLPPLARRFCGMLPLRTVKNGNASYDPALKAKLGHLMSTLDFDAAMEDIEDELNTLQDVLDGLKTQEDRVCVRVMWPEDRMQVKKALHAQKEYALGRQSHLWKSRNLWRRWQNLNKLHQETQDNMKAIKNVLSSRTQRKTLTRMALKQLRSAMSQHAASVERLKINLCTVARKILHAIDQDRTVWRKAHEETQEARRVLAADLLDERRARVAAANDALANEDVYLANVINFPVSTDGNNTIERERSRKHVHYDLQSPPPLDSEEELARQANAQIRREEMEAATRKARDSAKTATVTMISASAATAASSPMSWSPRQRKPLPQPQSGILPRPLVRPEQAAVNGSLGRIVATLSPGRLNTCASLAAGEMPALSPKYRRQPSPSTIFGRATSPGTRLNPCPAGPQHRSPLRRSQRLRARRSVGEASTPT